MDIFSVSNWFKNSTNKIKNRVGFEDIFKCIQGKGLIINTLPLEKQDCLIRGTLTIEQEVVEINNMLENGIYKQAIIVYGLNHTDDKVLQKQSQLISMGFQNVQVYLGGMFEWLLLQDVYGKEQFPTTNKNTVEILSYFTPSRV